MDSWRTDSRIAARQAFLKQTGWGHARVETFPGKSSTRSCFRLRDHTRSAILMDAPGAAEASLGEHRTPEYAPIARLTGPGVTAFTALACALTARGFSAPRVMEADIDAGFVILEDLGDALFARLSPDAADESTLYITAVETLAAIYRSSFQRDLHAFGHGWTLQDHDRPILEAEIELFADWYAPLRDKTLSDADKSDWVNAWAEVLPVLGAHAPGLNLRDYHAGNLIWLPERKAEARVGLLGFQNALFGHPAYDLVSLIEDPRRDVDANLVRPLTDRFFNAAGLADRDDFDAAVAVLAAQRNAMTLGRLVRSSKRDDKPEYLGLLPRVARHFVRTIGHPALTPVRKAVRKITPSVFAQAYQ